MKCLTSFQNNHCISGCSLGLVCYWNVRSGHVIHELEVEVEHSGVGVVKVSCSESYVVALLADSSVSVWDRSKGILTNIIKMVRDTCLAGRTGTSFAFSSLLCLPSLLLFLCLFYRVGMHTMSPFSVIRTLHLPYW